MLTSLTSVKFAIVWYQNQHLYFADVSARSSEEETKLIANKKKVSKIILSFISPDSGTLRPFIALEDSTSPVECVSRLLRLILVFWLCKYSFYFVLALWSGTGVIPK